MGYERPQEHAHEPARAQQAVPREAQRGPQRAVEAAAHVVLAVRQDWYIDGEAERLEAGARDPVDELRDTVVFAGKVGLEPRRASHRRNVFEARQRTAAHEHRNVGFRRGAGEHEIALIRRHRGSAHWCKAEGCIVSAAEERGLLRARGNIHQCPRHESKIVECGAVCTQRSVRFGAARNVAVHRPRQIAARRFLEILQSKDSPQGARQRLVRPRRRAACRREGVTQFGSGVGHGPVATIDNDK